MDGRIILGIVTSASLFIVTGCVTTPTQTTGLPPDKAKSSTSSSVAFKTDDTPWPMKPKGKRDPLPSTEIAFGKMKEAEADSPSLQANPEAQAQLRDDARKAYQQAIKLDPTNLDAQRHLGRLYVKMKDTDRAVDVYKKAVAKFPNEGCLWYDMGLAYTRRKDFNESMRCFAKALELDPQNRDSMKMLGMTMAWLGQYDQALAQLTRAYQGSPAMAHYDIARAMVQKDQIEPAKTHLRQALQANAQLEDARALLADLDQPNTEAANARVSLQGPQ